MTSNNQIESYHEERNGITHLQKTYPELSPEQIHFAEVVGRAIAEKWRHSLTKKPHVDNHDSASARSE